LSTLSELAILEVSFNHLSGDVGLAAPSLLSAYWHDNAFHSSLDFSRCRQLVVFDGSNNPWRPELPPMLPTTLQAFICSNCSLHGPVPASWAANAELSFLALSNNRITAPIPPLPQL